MINRLTNILSVVKLKREQKGQIFYLLPKTRASIRHKEKQENLRFLFTAERSPLFLYSVPGYLKLPHDTILLLSKLKPAERFFCIYLLSKYNQFGNKDFYLTDKQIGKDLAISTTTIWRWRKRLKNAGFISYISGKYEKSATQYHLTYFLLCPPKSISKVNTEHFKIKPKSISKVNPNKEVIKKEINKENYNKELEKGLEVLFSKN